MAQISGLSEAQQVAYDAACEGQLYSSLSRYSIRRGDRLSSTVARRTIAKLEDLGLIEWEPAGRFESRATVDGQAE